MEKKNQFYFRMDQEAKDKKDAFLGGKMTIYLLSGGIESLNRDSMTTSSAKYEFDLANHLIKYSKVYILSTKMQYGEIQSLSTLQLMGIRKGKNRFYGIKKILKTSKEKSVLIFWGYDLKKVLYMRSVKRNFSQVKILPFIFDSHKIAISKFSKIKKILADLYFELGRFFVRKFDGYIFFQEKAVSRLKIKKKPCFITKPGVSISRDDMVEAHVCNQKTDYLVTFCGSLTYLNGIDLLIDSLNNFEGTNFRFVVCGKGPLLPSVLYATKKYKNIEYLGVLPDKAISELYRKSSIILNLRRLEDEAMDFAFPSKFFEIVSTGKPIITTKIINDLELIDYIYLLEPMTSAELTNVLNGIISSYSKALDRAAMAKKIVLEKYNYDDLSYSLYRFLNREIFKDVKIKK